MSDKKPFVPDRSYVRAAYARGEKALLGDAITWDEADAEFELWYTTLVQEIRAATIRELGDSLSEGLPFYP